MKEKLGILAINLFSNNHGLTKIHVVWAYPPSYYITYLVNRLSPNFNAIVTWPNCAVTSLAVKLSFSNFLFYRSEEILNNIENCIYLKQKSKFVPTLVRSYFLSARHYFVLNNSTNFAFSIVIV